MGVDYAAISAGDSHNDYLGEAEADVSQWIEYFCQGMADSFVSVRVQAEKFKVRPDHTKLLRELDAKQKRILDFFRESRFLTTREIAEHLGVTPRTALNVCHTWLENGFILSHGEKKNRRYELTDTWVELL